MKVRKVFALLFTVITVVIVSACGNQKDVEDVVQNTTTESVESESKNEQEEKTEEVVTEETLNLKEDNSATDESIKGGTKPDFGTLSDDLYSFQVEINGDLYQFPMRYSDFVSYGWEYNEDDTEKLGSNYMLMGVFSNGKFDCYVDIANFDVNAQAISECYISRISVESINLRNVDDFSLRLPKGLEFGKATLEDIKEAYGTPSDTYEGQYSTKLTYQYDYYQKIEIGVSKESGGIESIKVQNTVMPDDFVASEVEAEVPEIVNTYIAPEKLDDSFDTFIVQYGGSFYQLPAPVSTFVTNGWKVDESGTDMVIAGQSFGYVTLMKDNQKLRVMANNYSEGATSIENCFVTTVKSGDYGNSTDIVISRNITIGMSEADLEKVLTGIEYEKDTSSTAYNYYKIIPGKSSLDNYEIYVKDKAVYKIEVQNSPRYSDYIK